MLFFYSSKYRFCIEFKGNQPYLLNIGSVVNVKKWPDGTWI